MKEESIIDKKLDKKAKFELKQQLKQQKQKQQPSKIKNAFKKPEFVDPTKPGEKKVLQNIESPELKIYIPQNVSSSWYDYWKGLNVFNSNKNGPSFSIIEFPNKLNGVNHLGIAANQYLQDTIARYELMKGNNVISASGFNHNDLGIEDFLERKILDDKISKSQISNEEFITKVNEIKDMNLKHIEEQLKSMAVIFNDESFNTLQTTSKKSISDSFIELFNAGLVERKPAMMNWSYYLGSPVPESDVKYVNIKGKTLFKVPGYDKEIEFGVINYLIYKIENSNEQLIVATTKPETMFADVAVAIHPHDERYKHLVGKNAIHPVNGDLLPVIFDDELVDMNFGTGAVRLAPSNNLKDYLIGLKHGLKFIQIFNPDGTLNENCGKEWKGLKRLESRRKVLGLLKEKNLFIKSEDNPMRIQISSKTGDVLEKRLHSYWFLNFKNKVELNDLKISAQAGSFKEDLSKELENLDNQNLPITTEKSSWKVLSSPSYYVKLENAEESDYHNHEFWVVAFTEEEAYKLASKKFPNEKNFKLIKDSDNFKSWFLDSIYPVSSSRKTHSLLVACTSDIGKISKSLIICQELSGKLPFEKILIHPLIVDFNDRKLSKELGNAFDPLFLIDGYDKVKFGKNLTKFSNNNSKGLKKLIKSFETKFAKGFNEFGSDTLRSFLIEKVTTSNENFQFNNLAEIDNKKKNLGKIYQFIKHVITELNNSDNFKDYSQKDFNIVHSYDKWIINSLHEVTESCKKNYSDDNFGKVEKILSQFWLRNLDKLYFEIIKGKLLSLHEDDKDRLNSKKILYFICETTLKLYHPFAPLLTEELYQRLTNNQYNSILLTKYPEEISYAYPKEYLDFEKIISLSEKINQFINSYGIMKNAEVIIRSEDSSIKKNQKIISYLSKKISLVSIINSFAEILNASHYANIKHYESEIYLLIKGNLDIEKEVEKNQLKLLKAQKKKEGVVKLQNGKDYELKASTELKVKHQKELVEFNNEIEGLEDIIQTLQKIFIS